MSPHRANKELFCFILCVWIFAAWMTHIVVCLQTQAVGFLVAGALFFPVGVVHGTGIWFGWW